MKILVVDTNIVFSGMLNTDSKIGQLLIKAPAAQNFIPVIFYARKFDDTGLNF